MPNLVGIGLSQVPTNSMLGGLAYQDPEHASIKNLDLKNLSQINSEIADTAVDVFVYDTSKDSDGGAWRKRTQHTSWYNETLNTATRGSRKEFPSVAVIVAEYEKLTIYDGDDPDLPMWMVFNYGTNNGSLSGMAMLYSNGEAVSALNGIISSVGGASWHDGLTEINFLAEFSRFRNNSNVADWSGGIVTRNTSGGYGSFYNTSSMYIVNAGANDVAMTVLPNAPVDSATGLPVPTIAVATDGGTSVIKDDETVADLTGFNPVTTVHIDADNVIGTSNSGTPSHDFIFKTHIPSSDETYNAGITAGSKNYYMNSNSGTIPLMRDLDMSDSTYDSKDDVVYRGGTGGFDIIMPGVNYSSTHSNPSIAYISKDYNTGYMVGDIKGAFLSDTDDTDISSTDLNLITNGDFSNGTTGWSNNATEIFTVSGGGVASVDRNGGSSQGQCYQTISTEIGKTYTVSVLVNAISNGFQVYANQGSTAMSQGAVNSTGTNYWTFTATTTSTRLDFSAVQNSTGTASFDNITIFDGVADRSVNNKGLTVYGTVTKSAVATGAELVAYSGFSASNYLEQYYNSLMEFGTGDFYMMAWIKNTDSTNNQKIITRDLNSTSRLQFYTAGTKMQIYTEDAGSASYLSSTSDFTTGEWICVIGGRKSGTLQMYVNGKFESGTGSNTNVARDLSFGAGTTVEIGRSNTANTNYWRGSIALARIGSGFPSAEQIKKMYEDEKVLFQENAACTLYGSSDAVTALDYDEVTDLLHVGTSAGRSDFQGLRRINNTTTAVTTAISAHDEFIIEQ